MNRVGKNLVFYLLQFKTAMHTRRYRTQLVQLIL
jgi:hypothetical protein